MTAMQTYLTKILLLVCFGALTGCMGGMGYQDMSADEIKALGKEANISCTEITGMWGRGKTVFLSVDRTVVDKGGIEVAPDCSVKFMNERQFTPPKLPDPKLPALPELQWAR